MEVARLQPVLFQLVVLRLSDELREHVRFRYRLRLTLSAIQHHPKAVNGDTTVIRHSRVYSSYAGRPDDQCFPLDRSEKLFICIGFPTVDLHART